MDFTVHNAAGEIQKSGSVPYEDVQAQAGPGETVLEGVRADDLTQYVADGEIVERPAIAGLDQVPEGTRVFVDGVDQGVCNDGAVEIETDIVGVYRVRLVPPFPYQPFETEVTIG